MHRVALRRRTDRGSDELETIQQTKVIGRCRHARTNSESPPSCRPRRHLSGHRSFQLICACQLAPFKIKSTAHPHLSLSHHQPVPSRYILPSPVSLYFSLPHITPHAFKQRTAVYLAANRLIRKAQKRSPPGLASYPPCHARARSQITAPHRRQRHRHIKQILYPSAFPLIVTNIVLTCPPLLPITSSPILLVRARLHSRK